MLEKYFIEHCSPTLASLKTANLFTCLYDSEAELEESIDTWNKIFAEKGIGLFLLRRREHTALIYVYRKNKLQAELQRPDIIRFLAVYGYTDMQIEETLLRLRTRLSECVSFPHEIGVFLGYPLEDVIGFIQNAGQNSKCSGCWKVYCNECEKRKIFEKFKKCKAVYTRLWQQGRSVLQLTVAA